MELAQAEKIVKEHGQEQLLRFFGELSQKEGEALLSQIAAIDWETISLWEHPQDLSGKGKISPIDGLKLPEISARREEFAACGREIVRGRKVGAVLLAGGQGTRLGSDAPKGAYNIGVTRPLYIFEQLIRNLLAVCKECGAFVPLYIMTSEKNDADTRAFFLAHDYFGYPASEIAFFMQSSAPCVGLDGKILLEGKGRIATSPNGNGGWYASLLAAGLGGDLSARGIEWLNVFSVDNVLQRIADPVFLGATALSGCNCGAKVVCKADPHERVGVLCLEDGKPNIIEYYELTEEMANARDEKGDLLYSYGVILNYLFRVSTLEEIKRARIPVHVVKKKVPFLGEDGVPVKPAQENAYKFETLILDMVRLTGSCLPFEVEREREFAPVKNATGTDSVESARELLLKNGILL